LSPPQLLEAVPAPSRGDVSSQVLHVTALSPERTIGSGDQQSEHEGGDRADQAGSKPDGILCVIGQMPLRQHLSHPHTAEGSGEDDDERYQRCG
jgi:hypothetical protein